MAKTIYTANGVARWIPDELLREIIFMERLTATVYGAAFSSQFALKTQVQNPDPDIARYLERKIARSLGLAGDGLATTMIAFGVRPSWFIPENGLESELRSEQAVDPRAE